jgi:hypothetical protein
MTTIAILGSLLESLPITAEKSCGSLSVATAGSKRRSRRRVTSASVGGGSRPIAA